LKFCGVVSFHEYIFSFPHPIQQPPLRGIAGLGKPLSMAGFNFIEAGRQGYIFVWRQREMLLQMAALPIALKIASLFAAIALGYQENFLRQGLITLPAYFIEGLLVAYAVRMAVYGTDPVKNGLIPPDDRRLIKASAIIYVLIKLAALFVLGLVLTTTDPNQKATPEESVSAFFMMIAILSFAIWFFRFLWLYVPVAMGYTATGFLKALGSYGSSFYLLALWMMVMAPFALLTLVMADGLQIIFPPGADDKPSQGFIYAFAAAQAFVETILALIASVAMGFAVREIMTQKP
jgi:hypothetical protein